MKLKATFAVLSSALLLQGCIAGVVVGSAAVATKTATDPRSVGTQVDDGTLEARVESALSKDQQLKKDARVVATAYQGKVLLTGQSPNADLTARAPSRSPWAWKARPKCITKSVRARRSA